MPKDEDRVYLPMKMNKIAKRSFMRFKRMTGWDLLDCHDWVYDIDLRNVKVYEELRSLSRSAIRRMRRNFCSKPTGNDITVSSTANQTVGNVPYMLKQIHCLKEKVTMYTVHAKSLSVHLHDGEEDSE